jgi:hypothetical protein
MEKKEDDNNEELLVYDLNKNNKTAEDKMNNFLICK